MKMYELVEAYQNILELDLEQDDLQTVLASLQGTIEEKVENIVKVMNQLNAEEAAYKAEIDRLSKHKATAKKKHDNLKEWLSDSLKALDIKKIDTPTNKISFRKSESVSIDDVLLIPKDYIVVKHSEVPDKTALKKAIKSGEDIPGAHIETKQNIQIK